MTDIIEKINLSEEILSALPKVTDDDKRHYISEANKIFAEYNQEKLALIEEMKQRRINFENSINVEPLEIVSIEDLEEAIKVTDPVNTAYEKLGLDEIFHHLDKFYRSNFERFNECIIALINIYTHAGVKLSSNDFFYNEYQNLYMQAVFSAINSEDTTETLKPYFEEYYWKNPNIIRDIKLNFKTLYYRHQKTFDNYVKHLQKEIDKSHTQVIKEYQAGVTQNNASENSNKKLFVAKFTDGTLNIKDYLPANIDKLANELIRGDVNDFGRTINSFRDILKEYASYLEFKEVIDKVSALIKTDGNTAKKSRGLFGKPKTESSKKIKEIFAVEKKLQQRFKKKKNNTDELIAKISNLFEEHEELYYKEALVDNINTESKILDLILFLSSYYGYYLKISKEFRDKEGEIQKTNDLERLKNLYLNPYVNLVNNLEVLKEHDISRIILDKYKLDNLKLESIKLNADTLPDLIVKTEKLCTYYDLKNIDDFDINQIDAYIKLINVLNKVE